jgi:branched-chain amino acid transport system ATP-binding protein
VSWLLIWGRDSLLRVTDASVDYSGAVALDEVSLEVGAGEVVGVIGNNGAGKTSLLKAISRVVPSRGRIEIDGRDVSGLAAHEIPAFGIAHVPEGRRLFPYLSVEDNLSLGSYPRGEPAPEDFERVYGMFPRLAERRGQQAGTLSGGEQQMAAIGRALMLRPKLLMLDEPSLGLAPVIVEQIYRTIDDLSSGGQTILLVEQNVAECLEVSDRVYVLQTGSIVGSGTAEELRKSEDIREAFLGI